MNKTPGSAPITLSKDLKRGAYGYAVGGGYQTGGGYSTGGR